MTIPAIRLCIGILMAAYTEISVVAVTAKAGIQTFLEFFSVSRNIGTIIPCSGIPPLVQELHVMRAHVFCWSNTSRTVDRCHLDCW